MNDSISRQKAVDAFMTILDKPNHAEFLYTDEICKVLNNLPSEQPEQRWIPCSERYLEQDERVIVTCGGYDFHVWDCMSNRGDNYFWEDELGLYHNKYEVIAWMPLIKPYKEREDR